MMISADNFGGNLKTPVPIAGMAIDLSLLLWPHGESEQRQGRGISRGDRH